MKLLVVTQRVDANDTNLGIHVSWLREFARRAELVTVIAQSVGTYDLPANVRVISLGKEKGAPKLFQLAKLKWTLLREMPRHDAVLVLMVSLYAVIAGIYGKFYRKPVYLWYTHKHVPFLLRVANVFVKRIFTASAESMNLKSDKVRVMGHAIDTERFSPSGTREPGLIVTVGRLSRTKDVSAMVDAVAELARTGPSVRLEVVGEPVTEDDRTYAAELLRSIEDRKLSGVVRLMGGIPYEKIPDIYRRASVCVNVSKTGSLDKAVLEAMAAGCPVVTSNPAFKDIVPSNCLVPRDDRTALVVAIHSQLEHPADPSDLRSRVVGTHDLARTLGALMDQIAADTASS